MMAVTTRKSTSVKAVGVRILEAFMLNPLSRNNNDDVVYLYVPFFVFGVCGSPTTRIWERFQRISVFCSEYSDLSTISGYFLKAVSCGFLRVFWINERFDLRKYAFTP